MSCDSLPLHVSMYVLCVLLQSDRCQKLVLVCDVNLKAEAVPYAKVK